MEKLDGSAERSGLPPENRLARRQEERGVHNEQADGVDDDTYPRERLGAVVLVGVTPDRDVGLEPLALGELVAREGVEGDVGDERVDEKEQLQQVGRRRLDQCSRRALARCEPAAQASQPNEYDEQRDRGRRQHMEDERGYVASHVEALEHRIDPGDPKADTDGEGGEQALHVGRQLDLVHVVDLGGDQVEAEEDLQLDVWRERAPRRAALRLAVAR